MHGAGEAAQPREGTADDAGSTLPEALLALRQTLARASFPLPSPGADDGAAQARGLVRQIDDYLVPRVERLDAPLLVVVGGSTGAGKSTLVNSLVRRPVSPAGVLRPTTRAPVLVHHPDDRGWVSGDRLLPRLPRAGGSPHGGGALRLVDHWRVPKGLVLLDAPDLDSVVESNRDLATQLLAAADLWLFVTSAARYADAVPWVALREARERSTAVAVVLDRVPAGATEQLVDHLRGMLAAEGLRDTPVFAVLEGAPDSEGLLPEQSVGEIREWLATLAADAEARDAVVRHTLAGALAAVTVRVDVVAAALVAQDRAVGELAAAVTESYERARDEVGESAADGSLLRGEVLARWQELVGTGQLLRGLESRLGRVRDRVTAAVTGRTTPAAELEVAIEGGVEALVRAESDAAAERAAAAWRSRPEGRTLLEQPRARGLDRSSPQLPERARRAVREWQAAVLDLVRTEGAGKRRSAKVVSYGVNGLGLLVMVAAFAHTGGLTGVEGGIAAGTSVLGQKVLEALLGDQAVRRLAARAREDLLARVEVLLADEAARFGALLPTAGEDGAELRSRAARVRELARLEGLVTEPRRGDSRRREAGRHDGDAGSSRSGSSRSDLPRSDLPGSGAAGPEVAR